ncbi:MAG: Rrf2 family transcriptional regulator [Alphaproteobacteria bacterium]|nr:Rrf2 family transcriptional regulator [Alphaproteobacteria bacterium]
MRLTSFTDYALRVLMYAAAHNDRLATIEETARAYGVSRAHLMKIVNQLTRAGLLRGVRGRTGGFELAQPPQRIRLGAVVRATEPDFALVECFGQRNSCVITARCRLSGVLQEALDSFLRTLDRYTLADLALDPASFGIALLPPEARAV